MSITMNNYTKREMDAYIDLIAHIPLANVFNNAFFGDPVCYKRQNGVTKRRLCKQSVLGQQHCFVRLQSLRPMFSNGNENAS